VNGEPVSFETDDLPFGVRPRITFETASQTTVEITFVPAPALVLPFRPASIGAPNQHLKIIDMRRDGEHLRTFVEGWAGETYTLEIVHPDLVHTIIGGEQRGSTLHVVMPDGPAGTFVRHEVVFDMISE
jgi:hypothetical protein